MFSWFYLEMQQKRGLLCASVAAYACLYLHLCVIKHENDYFCTQRQDE